MFLLASGLVLWVFPGSEFNVLENGYANLQGFFTLAPWFFLFLIPAVTMRMFAEEQKTGTIELLLSRPITDLNIVFAKYGAAVVLVLCAIVPSLIYIGSIYFLSSTCNINLEGILRNGFFFYFINCPQGNIDLAGITGSYIGLVFLCSAFVSIGIFSSVLTGNQVVSFILAVVFCFFFYSGFEFMSTFINAPKISNLLSFLGISRHYESLSRGVIDTRDVFYFLSLTLMFIFLSKFMLEKRKW